jgi:hypothetical protein
MLRQIIAAGMTALYLMIIFTPLASFAMSGTKSAAIGIRECTGDCDLCGCSPESRASHTCCCSKKRQQQAHAHDDNQEGASDCCNKKSEPHPTADKTADCCKKDSAPKKPVIIACGCPCGNKKQAPLSTGSSSEILPFHFTEQFTIPETNTTFSNLIQRLTSRLREPPDPPPQIS